MQSVYRGWKSRKEKDVHKDEQAVYTRDIVFSHPGPGRPGAAKRP